MPALLPPAMTRRQAARAAAPGHAPPPPVMSEGEVEGERYVDGLVSGKSRLSLLHTPLPPARVGG